MVGGFLGGKTAASRETEGALVGLGQDIHTNPRDMDGVRQSLQQIKEILDRFSITVAADGMTADPETDQEAGYMTYANGSTSLQIPGY